MERHRLRELGYYHDPEKKEVKLNRVRVYGRRPEVKKRHHEYLSVWRRNNPENVARSHHKYRAMIAGNGGCYTIEEINNLFIEQEYRCFYCNKPFFDNTLAAEYHVEHKTPVSRGGSSDISNIAIACPKCNHSKRDKTAEEFLYKTRGII